MRPFFCIISQFLIKLGRINYILFIFNHFETHQLHIFYIFRCNWYVSTQNASR